MRRELATLLAGYLAGYAIIAAVACTTAAVTPPPPEPVKPDLILLRGETSEIRMEGPCPTIAPPQGFALEALEFRSVETTRPSYIGAAVGKYKDALVPCETGAEGVWLDVTAKRDAVPGIHQVGPFKVEVLSAELPVNPTMPFYSEISSRTAWRLSGLPDHVKNEAAAVKPWVEFLRAHRIEPIKQHVTVYPPANLEQWKEYGADLYTMVVNGAIAPPMVIRYDPTQDPPVATLQAIEAAIQAGRIPQGAWDYVRDEGEPGGLDLLLRRAAAAKEHAPSMKRYATWTEKLVGSALDAAWPVAEWYPTTRTMEHGIYFSCMAQGNCSDGPARNPTGTPLSVIEAEPIHTRIQPVMAYALGASRALYYKVDKRMSWEPGGQWNEGGNGDGTALYFHQGKVAASVRVKNWRKGSNDVEYLKLLGDDGKGVVRTTRDWEKSPAKLDELRPRLAEKLRRAG